MRCKRKVQWLWHKPDSEPTIFLSNEMAEGEMSNIYRAIKVP